MSRPRLIAAVRARMRSESAMREAPAATPAPSAPAPRPSPRDPRIDQLAAEAQYHRDRFELHRARVISGSSTATSLGRLRELERTATAAQERLAHARSVARGGG
jgi:hypothetical protein